MGFSVLLLVARLLWIDYAEMRFSVKQVNVSPLLVLFTVALLGWMWGAVGMLLAVPLLTVARVVLGSFPKTRFVASLISDVEDSMPHENQTNSCGGSEPPRRYKF